MRLGDGLGAIRIGHLSTFYHTSMLLMADPGLSANAIGSGIDWRLYGTGPAIVEAFSKNEIDLAYIGLPPAIIGMDNGVNIKCIAGGHMEGTVMAGLGHLKGHPEIGNINDVLSQFKGQTIGVPGKGSIHDVIASDAISKAGLSGEIEIVNYKWADEIIEEMRRGRVSAAFGTPALAAALMHYLKGRILYPPYLLWPNNPSYGIAASLRFLQTRRKDALAFLRLHESAEESLRRSPKSAASKIAKFIGFVEEGLILNAMLISPKYCSKITDEYIKSTMLFADAMRGLGYIKRCPSMEEIFDLSLIEITHPEAGHYLTGGDLRDTSK